LIVAQFAATSSIVGYDTLHHEDGTWRFHRRVAEFVQPG
jgi:hypothetical protein